MCWTILLAEVETFNLLLLPTLFLLACFAFTTPAEEEFPGMRQVETSSLHRGVAGARHSFLPLPGSANKLDVLLQVRQALIVEQLSSSATATVH